MSTKMARSSGSCPRGEREVKKKTVQETQTQGTGKIFIF
jgi:hypothetical protein